MDIEAYRNYCLAKIGVTESFPFDQKTLVFKVGGKMFALADIDQFSYMNLKCDPERAIELREQYAGIRPGWHMNKTYWNSVDVRADVPQDVLHELIDHSYELIVSSLSKKLRDELQAR